MSYENIVIVLIKISNRDLILVLQITREIQYINQSKLQMNTPSVLEYEKF